jgi:hypothetical protein
MWHWDLLSPSDILLLQDLMGEDGMHSYNEQAGETCLEQVSGNLNTLNGHHGAKRMSGTYIGGMLRPILVFPKKFSRKAAIRPIVPIDL